VELVYLGVASCWPSCMIGTWLSARERGENEPSVSPGGFTRFENSSQTSARLHRQINPLPERRSGIAVALGQLMYAPSTV